MGVFSYCGSSCSPRALLGNTLRQFAYSRYNNFTYRFLLEWMWYKRIGSLSNELLRIGNGVTSQELSTRPGHGAVNKQGQEELGRDEEGMSAIEIQG